MSSRHKKCSRYDGRDRDYYDAQGYESNSESSSEEELGGYPTSNYHGSVRPINKNRYPEPSRYHRSRPTLGLTASRSRMRSQQMDNYSSTTYSSTNLSSSFSTTNDTTETDPSELYTPIDRSHHASRHKSRGLPMVEDLSPVRANHDNDDDIFAQPLPPPLGRFVKNFRPQHTSTTMSIKPISHMTGVPRMGSSSLSGGSSGMVTSTPRSSVSHRVPPLTSYNQVLSMTQNSSRQRPNSYYGMEQADYKKENDYMRPASSRSVPDTPDCYKPEHYGLNPCYAKKSDLTGIVHLKVTLTGKYMVSIDVDSAVYFFNPKNKLSTFITVEKRNKRTTLREDDRHSSRKRETTSRKGERRQARQSDTIWNCNRPEFRAKFDIKLSSDYRKESIFLAAWSVQDLDARLHPEMIGCMTFDVKRLFKKAQSASTGYFDENMSEEIVVCNDGYFFLDQKLGERKNMPQNKLQSHRYYEDLDVGVMTNSSRSSGDMTGSSKMPMEEFVTASRNFGQSLVPGYSADSHMEDNLNFSTASSSTNSGVMSHGYSYHLHRNTLPSITTTSYSSSNNDGLSGISSGGPNGTTDFQHLYVDPSQCDGKIPKNHVFVRPSPSKKEASVRRAASFTYSPKGSGDKLNKRQVKEEPREFLKKMSFNPIQKTLSFLRNKMDGSNSSIAHPSKDDVTLWKTSFESLLRSKFGNQLFRQFLNKEMSVENLDFWESCEEFRNKWKDDKKSMTKKANEIYQKFITEQAPNQVNLDCATREATKAALHSGCEQDTFSLSQNIIEKLMETDSYKRFLKDAIYLDVLRSFDVDNNNQQKH